jgi:nitroreductase
MNKSESSDEPYTVLTELLEARYSCRGFTPEPVPRETIDKILSLAQRTASWCNSQAWQVCVASAQATERFRAELLSYVNDHAAAPDFDWPTYEGVYLERRRECGFQLYAATGVARGDREAADRQRLENFRFFGAPHVALVTAPQSLGVYGVLDCGAYVSNFALAARALGVSSIAQAALAAYPGFWREKLALPSDRQVVCGISFGFENAAHPANSFRTSRAAIDRAATWIDW